MHEHDADHAAEGASDEARTAEEFWEERYADGRTWSGRANALLVAEVEALAPGDALDLGAGEGGDAVWLARQGWTVTATDVSSSALALGAEAAEEEGVAGITWEQHDLAATFPAGEFDLVASAYLHAPPNVPLDRDAVFRRAADAVRPGGSLVIVGHAGPPHWVGPDHPSRLVALPTPEEVLAALDLAEEDWQVVTCKEADVAMEDPDGQPATRPDGVLHVRRRR